MNLVDRLIFILRSAQTKILLRSWGQTTGSSVGSAVYVLPLGEVAEHSCAFVSSSLDRRTK